jgi:hypothetical protein
MLASWEVDVAKHVITVTVAGPTLSVCSQLLR